jgi:hypothetical protein
MNRSGFSLVFQTGNEQQARGRERNSAGGTWRLQASEDQTRVAASSNEIYSIQMDAMPGVSRQREGFIW